MKKTFILLIFFLLTFVIKSYTQEETFIAISMYNFTRYVDWPVDDASSDFIIDIIGHKSVYEKLKDMTKDRTVGSRRMVIRYLDGVSNITKSDILFLGFWQSKDMAKALTKVGNAHTLVISEKDGMIDAGAAINFVIRNNVIKFEVKRTNILKYGLKVTEELSSLAYKSY
jgi:hypothetical protein